MYDQTDANNAIREHEFHLIIFIAARAARIAESVNAKRDRLNIIMDLEAAHEDTPLDLEGLLKASASDFCHDVFGIERHLNLNRKTRKLEDCFSPRYARR